MRYLLLALCITLFTLSSIASAAPTENTPKRGIYKDISPEGKALQKELTQKSRAAAKESNQRLLAIKKEMVELVAKEPFDSKKLSELLKEESAVQAKKAEIRHGSMVTILEKLSAADRKIVAAQMKTALEKNKKRKQKQVKEAPLNNNPAE